MEFGLDDLLSCVASSAEVLGGSFVGPDSSSFMISFRHSEVGIATTLLLMEDGTDSSSAL